MVTISFTLAGQQFELSSDDVRTRLAGHRPDAIDQYWVEIDDIRWPVKQVMSLATGLSKSDFQSQNSRRLLAKLGFPIGRGSAVLAVTPAKAPPTRSPGPRRAPNVRLASSADAVLVGCVRSKLPGGAPAKDLYTSHYFAKMRAYAEGTGRPWFILSAEHGLVSPDEWLEPYDCYLPEMSRDYRRAWGQKVASQLEAALGSLAGLTLDIHAGSTYVQWYRRPSSRSVPVWWLNSRGYRSAGGCPGTCSRACRRLARRTLCRSCAIHLAPCRSAISSRRGASTWGLLGCTAGGSTIPVPRTSVVGWGTR